MESSAGSGYNVVVDSIPTHPLARGCIALGSRGRRRRHDIMKTDIKLIPEKVNTWEIDSIAWKLE
jgi:hypothetical protein